MARATLSYTLPEEEAELRAAIQGRDAQGVLWSFDQYLRARIKHEDLPADVDRALQAARDELRSMCDENGVSFDV